MSIKRLFKSFRYAFRGLWHAFTHEQNLQIHIGIGLLVISLALYLNIKNWELIIVLLLIFSIIILELINTVFERLADMLKPRIHSYVAVIKDLMAATVLIASLAAIIIGGIIFFPYLANLLK
jgi:diacylglycerol kinase